MHPVIASDGIIIVLESGVQLPETFDTIAVTLPYTHLGPALRIRTEPPLTTRVPPEPPPPIPVFDYTDEDDVAPFQGDIDPSLPMIALSFDDGPGVYTEQFLDLLEQYGVRATFCVIGNLVNTQTAALARAVEMESEVIGHSWNHRNLAKLTEDIVHTQITDTSSAIRAATGTSVPAFRPPYGAVSDTMREVAAELGYAIIYWSVDSEDWKTKDADAIYNAVMQNVKDGAIILSHEIYRATLEAYQRIIPELLLQGYQIVTVSELLYFRHGELTPGNVYYDGHRDS
jgi:peptidoglycan/xylan/chitin deacetylase (PgdA/CDA1 family)